MMQRKNEHRMRNFYTAKNAAISTAPPVITCYFLVLVSNIKGLAVF
jgi:hypothetical protein